jgi:hypothetical protein
VSRVGLFFRPTFFGPPFHSLSSPLCITLAAPPHVLVSLGSSSLTTEVVIVPNAHADALKDAIITKLKLDVPATRLQLLRVAGASEKPLPLESSTTLAEQGVGEGSRVIAEVIRE